MNIIDSKNNFDLFNKLAVLLSYVLIAFSILSLVLYITNLIISHISKNKKNLGTLKAFGLSNNYIIFIYSSISITMVALAFIISYFVAYFLGDMLINLIAEWQKIGDAGTSLKYISYPLKELSIFFILIPSIIISFKLWLQLRKATPGDLIYER